MHSKGVIEIYKTLRLHQEQSVEKEEQLWKEGLSSIHTFIIRNNKHKTEQTIVQNKVIYITTTGLTARQFAWELRF